MSLWIAPADVVPGLVGAGAMTGGAPKTGHHSTEGSSYAGARAAYASSGNGPHLTDTFENGRYQVRQHLPLNVAATALLHPAGTGQTNRDNVIQIEHVGFAATAWRWAPEYLAGIAALCRAIEAATGCPSAAPLPFLAPGTAPRASWDAWHAVGGHYGHEHVPSNDHCVAADTPVLRSDGSWVSAIQLGIGDELVTFEESASQVGSLAGRRFCAGQVTRNAPFTAEAVRVVTEAGDLITTLDHPWLVRRPGGGAQSAIRWKQSQYLTPGVDRVYFAARPWSADRSHDAGWLAGQMDAEGSIIHGQGGAGFRFGQVESTMLDRFTFLVEERGFLLKQLPRRNRTGFKAKRPFIDLRVVGGLFEILRLLASVGTTRFDTESLWNDRVVGKTTKRVAVLAVEPVGRRLMAGLTTSTRTFVAGGFLVHNTDPGAMDIAAILAPVPAPPPVAWLTLPADQEDDGIMRQVELDCGVFDGQGRGAVLFDGGAGPEPGITHYPVAIRWDDVRGVDLQGSFPPVDGYRGLSKVGRQNRDGFLCVQFDGGPPGGPVTVVVTVRS